MGRFQYKILLVIIAFLLAGSPLRARPIALGDPDAFPVPTAALETKRAPVVAADAEPGSLELLAEEDEPISVATLGTIRSRLQQNGDSQGTAVRYQPWPLLLLVTLAFGTMALAWRGEHASEPRRPQYVRRYAPRYRPVR
jgi:hypothetical protein